MSGHEDQGFAIRHICPEDADGILSVLNQAFERHATMAWFRWKHQFAPWGPSRGWVATNGDGRIVGVRLITPWSLSGGGSGVPITRAMDGAIAPSAQRRGLFSRLVSAEMDLMAAGGRRSELLYSTSVPASREAYRKLGWDIRDVPHTASLVAPAPLRAIQLEWDDALEQGELPVGRPGGTAWTSEALRWRIDRHSGYEYRTVRLRNSDRPHGVILRRAKLKSVPTTVVVYSWGAREDVETAIRAASTRLGAPLVLSAGGGTFRWGRPVGSSTVSAWSGPSSRFSAAISVASMRFDFADVEGVM